MSASMVLLATGLAGLSSLVLVPTEQAPVEPAPRSVVHRLVQHELVPDHRGRILRGCGRPAGLDPSSSGQRRTDDKGLRSPCRPEPLKIRRATDSPRGVAVPRPDAGFDYQLGGAYPLPDGVSVVSRDRRAPPAPGAYSICYVNAFQTQPGRLGWWRRHHPALLLRDGQGALVRDPGWPGEVLLDVASRANRRQLAAVVGRWVDRCADDGFAAVEPDNLDSFSRSRRLLTRADDLALASLLADRAHAAGLAIAQKNVASLTRAQRLRTGFDFAVAEECSVWRECASYAAAYGRHVLEIEYTDNGRRAFARACNRHGDEWSVILRDRMLRPPANQGYAYQAC